MENSNKTKITKEMRETLRGDFPEEAYKSHPTKTFLTTLKAMYITERLNDVFGIGRWTVNHSVVERNENYVLVEAEFQSLDYEVIVPKQYGGHTTTGKNTEIADGFKSAVTDATSKIASYLEIGIEMFKGNINVKPVKNLKNDSKKELPWLNEKQGNEVTRNWKRALATLREGKSLEYLKQSFRISAANQAILLKQSKQAA
ncbi:hypothetical protein [Aquimarina algiphila]|uniref:Uncharacterized protein n=1 Tax=Aquimarina algiphila TaxID=2047982 RepID=A0A554VAQ9_9FLAO|nr:hypothetical protein [Aquimarina algiphila]TSE03354.1 hypothetical protein FOF46_29575 [Aquimarina algiphila]